VRAPFGRKTKGRIKNADRRTREHLAEHEVERLIKAAKCHRHGDRDSLMIFMAYRHGLRASEVADLRWEQIDFKTAHLHVRRVKGGLPSTSRATRSGFCAGIIARVQRRPLSSSLSAVRR
jgi:integrase